ncbi:hypothetical protein V8F20_007981 [Naviculisporaceae sp. PSN 640]
MAPIPTVSIGVPQIKTYHKKSYPAISPSKPSLSQYGRNVLVTGAGGGIGYEIAKSFVQAYATKLIIIGRRKDVIDKAVNEFMAEAKSINSPTEVIGRSVDASDPKAVAELWGELQAQGIFIDVLVLNHAVTGPVKPIIDVDLDEEWNIFNINVRSIIDFTQRFWKQSGDKKKYLVNVSSSAVHNWWTDGPLIPSYGLTKASGLLVTQQIANDVAADKMQIVSFHPGGVQTEAARNAGAEDWMYDWDDVKLPADFAVWAATDEAEFLHGRWLDAHWDVDEIRGQEFRDSLTDKNFSRLGLVGVQRIDGQ